MRGAQNPWERVLLIFGVAPHLLVLKTDFAYMIQQVCWIFIYAIGAGLHQFCFSVASTKQANSQRLCPARREQIPSTVTDYDAIAKSHAQTSSGCKEHIRMRLSLINIITGNNRNAGRNAKWLDHLSHRLPLTARGNCPLNASCC